MSVISSDRVNFTDEIIESQSILKDVDLEFEAYG